MYMFLCWLVLVMVVCSILCVLGAVISKKSKDFSKEKTSPFECGFNPCGGSRVSFSFHFFLVALIFIVFDVELLLLYPYVLVFQGGGSCSGSEVFLFIGFVLFLSVGYFWEWSLQMLKWKW